MLFSGAEHQLCMFNDMIDGTWNKPLAMQAKKAKQAQSNQDIHKSEGYIIRGHALTADEVLEVIEKLDTTEAIIQEMGRTKRIKVDDTIETVPSPDAFVAFVTLDNNKECVAVIEFDSTIAKEFVENDGLDDGYHTTITVFEPDVSKNGVPRDYYEYLNSKHSNRALEIIEESPNPMTENGENLATVKEMELSNSKIAQPETVVKKIPTTDSDGNPGVRNSIGSKTDAAAQEMLEKENEALREDLSQLKDLLKFFEMRMLWPCSPQ